MPGYCLERPRNIAPPITLRVGLEAGLMSTVVSGVSGLYLVEFLRGVSERHVIYTLSARY